MKTINEYFDKVDATNHRVSYGFIGRSDETKELYNLEEQLSELIRKCAKAHVDLVELNDDMSDNITDPFWEIGVTSTIDSILEAFDNKCVMVAVYNWIIKRSRFSGDFSDEAKTLVDMIRSKHFEEFQ